ncbi:Fic/DOC family protein [Bifidobacterium saguini DSM 23967]|uniref:Fic/DOC family protein n=2 Tax=Bifidobacterium saguini TaxID=762210 RepID=A0A087D5N1_9BIFI|nr:Fic family protein [Bifidobacterium saguini]KFI90831.1 Fic/DOC family protein [Bifidobacterium saguini DSM 23967]QTB90751.1 Fic family protein [Bifidobacterium saguini]
MPNPTLSRRIKDLPAFLASMMDAGDMAGALARVDDARAGFRALAPFDGVEESALDDYRREWMARYVYNSNAIEGSTLTLEDTELVLEGEFVPSDSPARYIFAARGVADGMAYVERYVSEHRPLSVELVRKLHEVTALDVQPVLRGRFRPYGYTARITATRVKTADPLEIYEDMESLVDAVNASDAHPVLKAAGFHVMFENIHPFADGNGRTGRQILNLMLMDAGYSPVAIKHDAGRSYGRSLEAWQVGDDPRPFVSILARCVEQEENAKAGIIEGLRENPLTMPQNTDSMLSDRGTHGPTL